MSMSQTDEAIINAIQRVNDPDVEPYRGSDDEENENDSDSQGEVTSERQRMDPEIEAILEDQQLRQSLYHQGGAATGPKGVIADYKFHQKQNALRRLTNEKKIKAKIGKGALSSGWLQRQLEDEQFAKEEQQIPPLKEFSKESISMRELREVLDEEPDELDDLLEDDDEFMMEYRKQRLAELKRIAGRTRYGQLQEIDVSQYVEAIDNEDSRTAVIIHLYQPNHQQCRILNQYLMELARKYRLAKFLCIVSTKADPTFDEVALPTLLCYRNKDLVANLVRITDELPLQDNGVFNIDDLEALLLDTTALTKDDILDVSRLSINGPMMGRSESYDNNFSDDSDE